MKVCLVDSRVKESSVFLESVQDDVTAVLLDYENDSFESLLAKIGSAESIAYVAHGTFDDSYSFFKGSSFDMLVKEDWQPFFDFVRAVNAVYFDFLGCNMASDDRWKQVFLWMEESGVKVRASTDATGNLALGGNWILEDGSVDAKELYFKEGIEKYIGLLVLYNFNSKTNGTTITNVTPLASLTSHAETATDWYSYTSSTYNSNMLTYVIGSSIIPYTTSEVYNSTGTYIKFNSYVTSGYTAYLISPAFTASNYVTFQFDFGQDGLSGYSSLDNISIGLIPTPSISSIATSNISAKLTRNFTGGPTALTSLNTFFITFSATVGNKYCIYVKCYSTAAYDMYMDNFNILQSSSLLQYTSSNTVTANTIYRITSSPLRISTLAQKTVSGITALSAIDTSTTVTLGYLLFNNELYKDGSKDTTGGYYAYNGILYNNGTQSTGYYGLNGILYNNGLQVTTGGYYGLNGILYNNGLQVTTGGYYLYNSILYNNGTQSTGYYLYNSILYNNGTQSTGYYGLNGILYNNGIQVTTGGYYPYNGMLYNNGIKTTVTYYNNYLYYNNDITIGTIANTWTNMAYGNCVFVAISSAGQVSTSSDGSSWSVQTATINCNHLTYGGTLFVAVASNTIYTSSDGITWNTITVSSNLTKVVYRSSDFIAIASTEVVTSSDGIVWTVQTANIGSCTGIAYGANVLVTVSSTGTNRIVSYDGSMTPTQVYSMDYNWIDVTYGNGLFVAVASTGEVARSSDGSSWTLQTTIDTYTSIAYGAGLFVAVLSTGTNRIRTSPDGITWTSINSMDAYSLTKVAYGNGVFISVSSAAVAALKYSVDYNAVSQGITVNEGTNVLYSSVATVPTNAGSYTVTADSNISFIYTIRKIKTLMNTNTVTYNGSIQTLAPTGSTYKIYGYEI